MSNALNILIVDDNDDDAALIALRFRAAGYQITATRVETADDMTARLRAGPVDVIIADVTMPRFSAAEALKLYWESGCDCPFVVVSGTISEDTAVPLLKAGAHDFVVKTNLARLVPATERELREAAGRRARRQAEDDLRVSEERYALAARGANDGLWDWDLGTNRIYFSPRWKDMLGLPEAESCTAPDTWFRAVHPDDTEILRQQLDDHLAGQTAHFSAEYRMRHQDGRWRWMSARGLGVIDEQGIPCRIAGSQRDITAQKETEQCLRRAKTELEEAVAAKSRFLAAASHDLRQPLQAMFCFAAVLEGQVVPAGQATVRDLGISLTSLKSLLDALLDVSRLDAGVVSPQQSCFPVNAVLRQMAVEMGAPAEAKGLTLRIVESAACIRTDPVLLARILRNLIENAIRYTERGGILVGCRRRNGALMIAVHDTGPGIPQDAQARIFEEFFQIGNAERDRMKGLGLGLAIVSRLSRLLDHPITLHSGPGRGSSFAVTVPLVRERSADSPPAVFCQPVMHPANGTVLVIEDETMVASALASLLEAWGFEPILAASLDEANTLLSVAPQVVVADYRLRDGYTGLDAVTALRRRFARVIPCIVVTGDTAAERLREISDSGALLLHKPVTPTDLRRALHTMLAGPPGEAETSLPARRPLQRP